MPLATVVRIPGRSSTGTVVILGAPGYAVELELHSDHAHVVRRVALTVTVPVPSIRPPGS